MKTNWKDKRVLILGAARQGLALARWLSIQGARVTLNDVRGEQALRAAKQSLAEFEVTWALGGHPLELLDSTDVLCLSGGIPLTLPLVAAAVSRGIPLSNDSQIFMEVVPCRTIGITGSAGKTTTTTLVGNMAKLAYGVNAYVGGNIGDPLLNYVDTMKPEDIAILELSSFQLEQMTLSPNVAAILNITPNHLDRHGTMEAYTAAKARILEFQSKEDAAIVGHDDPGAWNLRNRVRGRLLTFSMNALDEGLDGAYLHDGLLNLREGNAYLPLLLREKIQLRGDHNVQNVLAAFAIGHAAGFPLDSMLEAVEEFRGVPHRLEFVREWNGVRWYNDSIATAPERSMAAIRSFEEPIVLLLGGRDKDLPWEDLLRLANERVDHIVLFGEAAEKIEKTAAGLASERRRFSLTKVGGLEEAVRKAAEVAEPGDVVLLSPGGTSFDEFVDFAERGERFAEWVRELS
ncbi:MAG: UDP-N-acetylmuramoyl-L-alanine--D-glutamate ligase [Chloroflexi bacterium]|nr:UDP-N-acetylmuramoyl-L-alanine--D-glutamate ligase [Chloroflexota bacterium]